MDYTIFYKNCFEGAEVDRTVNYDFFFSAFDDCDRTKVVFERISADSKYWIEFPHYRHVGLDIPNLYKCTSFKEDECFIDLFDAINIRDDSRICIDITGFIRPHLIFFIVSLHRIGLKKIDFLYTEPQHYVSAESTSFSGFVEEVKIIEGCGSPLNFTNTDEDLLIIAAGYDDKLMTKVAQDKSKIKKKYYIIGFPSLQPDMYQESILKIYDTKESIGMRIDKYAPAFDPFVTAQVIHEIVEENRGHTNIYLSPVSTKPQALGMALYYLWNYTTKPVNIIFPYSNKYFPRTASGIKKTWRYTFELS